MDILKKIFPGAFGVKDVTGLIIRIVIYVVIGAIVTCLGAIISLVPFAGGVIAGILGTLSSVYCLIGIVLVVLDFLKILK